MASKKKTSKALVVPAQTTPARRTRGRIRAEGASFPLAPARREMPAGYVAVLADLKQRIAATQTHAVLAVNRELVSLYWHVGATLVERQARAGWGDAVVERLAHDVRRAFPDLQGFSTRNIWRMRAFFRAWSDAAKKLPQAVAQTAQGRATKKLPQAVAQTAQGRATKKLPQLVAEIPWGHNIVLLEKLERPEERLWYAEQTREHGWSRPRDHLRHCQGGSQIAKA